jgi:hypothetical protein
VYTRQRKTIQKHNIFWIPLSERLSKWMTQTNLGEWYFVDILDVWNRNETQFSLFVCYTL